jgi:thiol peroxidase
MAKINLGAHVVHTSGDMPQTGQKAPEFNLTGTDLNDVQLSAFAGHKVVLNVFPSIDTQVCAASVRMFNKSAIALENTKVINISRDLPFAFKRFCAAEGLDNVTNLAEYKNHNFGQAYGLDMVDGKLAGLLSRAVLVLDENGKVVYTEQVPDIGEEPNYEAALAALKG